MHKSWWKVLGIIFVLYTIVAGFLFPVPEIDIVKESIRNLYFHVPMWFGMTILLCASFIYSIKYLRNPSTNNDIKAAEAVHVALLLGFLGLTTGMIWAQNTWGAFWTNDPQLNSAAIGVLIYLSYAVLRNSIEEEQNRARISAIMNVFAFPVFIVVIFVLPRLTASLHPGKGGNPGFNAYDLDNQMRFVFYPAVMGWTLLATWIASLRVRVKLLENNVIERL